MDLALIAMRKLKKEGKLADQEESEEINACSIVVPVEIDGKTEEWLVNFKKGPDDRSPLRNRSPVWTPTARTRKRT